MRALAILGLVGLAIAAGTAGSLDATFGADGLAVDDFGFEERAWAVAFQSDGKIIAIGELRHTLGPDPSDEVIDWAVARYNTDGTLDTTFGTDGTVSPLATDEHGVAVDVAVDSNNRIVVVGYQWVANTTTSGKGKKKKTTTTIVQSVALVRLNADGTLDTGFGDNGVVLTDVPGSDWAMANSVVLLSDGDILVAGQATFVQTSGGKGRGKKSTVESEGAILLRYNLDGTLDSGFGDGGIVVDDFSTGDDAVTLRGLGVQSSGKIVICGRFGFLRRYHSDGVLDTSFGSNGQVDAPDGDVYLGGLTIDSQDRILAAGYRGETVDRDGLVVRYEADGTLDWTYRHDAPEIDELRGVAIDSTGKIVAGGNFVDGTIWEGYVVRLNDDGTADTGFSGEVASVTGGLVLISDLALDASDDILLAGGAGIPNGGVLDWLVARYCGN